MARKPLTSDTMVSSTLAASYVDAPSRSAGTAAELVALGKSANYANLQQSHILSNFGLRQCGSINESDMSCYVLSAILAITFLWFLVMTLKAASFLFQRLSVTIQRFNAILMNDTFSSDKRDWGPSNVFSLPWVFSPWDFLLYRATEGNKIMNPYYEGTTNL